MPLSNRSSDLTFTESDATQNFSVGPSSRNPAQSKTQESKPITPNDQEVVSYDPTKQKKSQVDPMVWKEAQIKLKSLLNNFGKENY
jgi:hypothetical protein